MSRLLSILGLRTGDGPTVAPSLAYAFLGVGAMSFAAIAADTLFVSAFELGAISRFYVVTAAVRFGAAAAYAGLARRFRGPSFDAALLAATAISMGVSGALAHGGSPAVLYGVCVALVVLPPLLPLMTFKSVSSSLSSRQARRLLPLVAAAATLGTVVVGVAVPFLAASLGTPGLLYAGGLLAAVAAPLPFKLLPGVGPPPESDEAGSMSAVMRAPLSGASNGKRPASVPGTSGPAARSVLAGLVEAGRDLRNVPVVAVVLAVTLLGAAAANFVDYGLKATLKARYARDEMAAFLGTFGALANLAVLVIQLFGTSRFVARFGVRAALAAPFAAIAGLGAWAYAAPSVAATAASKFAETTFHYALSAPVADLLLTPAPPRAAMRGKVIAKGVAGPAGALLAGLVLASFGDGGPPLWALGAIVAALGALGVAAVSGAKRAYTLALADALGEGRIAPDLPGASSAALRSEIADLLAESIAEGDVAGATRTLSLFDDRHFSLDDLAPALRAEEPGIRRAAVAAALRIARADGGPATKADASSAPAAAGAGVRLLELARHDVDDETERTILAAARALGAPPPRARLELAAARARAAAPAARAAADLWAEALVGLAWNGGASAAAGAASPREAAVHELRKEALVPGSPRRAPALRALGDLRERRAQKEVLLSLGSSDSAVFAEAARTAVLIEAHGAVAALLGRLSSGSEVRAVTRALSYAGPHAIDDLIAALPTTRGQGAPVSTSIASGGSLTGSVRAARVLARLGAEACARVLDRYPELGYRARNAVARALATVARQTGDAGPDGGGRAAPAIDPGLVLDAMELTLAYAESLLPVYPRAPEGLLRRELRHRIEETAARLLDLASVLGDRELITRARAALARKDDEGARARGHALELLENVLPRPFAARAVSLHEVDWSATVAAPEPEPARGGSGVRGRAALPALDGWLEKCRAFDANELASAHPMLSVLEKVVVLVDSSLFTGLSGEELYPVAEIAQAADYGAGDVVVRKGDPGDALFVVASGSFAVVRDETTLRHLGPGAVFGEMSLLDGAPRAATVCATAPGRLLRIPRAEFEALLDESPELSRGVIRTLLGHLRATSA